MTKDIFYWGKTPAKPKLASSVLCVRPTSAGYEVLLARRPKSFKFAGGKYVFPGGKLDSEDYDECVLENFQNATKKVHDKNAPETLRGLQFAAVRELYEEVAILLGASEMVLPLGHPSELHKAPDFYRKLKNSNIKIDLSKLIYWNNWVTPKPMPVRFDTFFFVALMDEKVQATASKAEVDEVVWLHPSDAIALSDRGELPLMFPTYKNLELLADVKTVGRLLKVVESFSKLPIEPEMIRNPTGVVTMQMPDVWDQHRS